MKAILKHVDELHLSERAAMLALLDRHFHGVCEEVFRADLGEKTHALLLWNDDGELCGFSTLRFCVEFFEGRRDSLLVSGDTIVDPGSWGANILSRAWIEAVLRLHREMGEGDLWWLLLTSGFRTYRLLTGYWLDFLPRFDRASDPERLRRRDHFARALYGDRFDPVRGVVVFPRPQMLRGTLAGIPPGRLRDPHVAFFQTQNPGHPRGDELVCLARLGEDNLTPAGRRVVDHIRREPVLSRDE
ncbi:MAG: hypothetical protein JJU29_18570 [Verrucomicrobia bacterium]|nr:hypothetical protein [Verrucomicrobiota bacterium]MCH8512398.1 hypothetical protein [Kiritimatiellia bacterium]